MPISEAMMIPPSTPFGNSGNSGQTNTSQQMNMPNYAPAAARFEGQWGGSNWPASFGRANNFSMTNSPFGRSVDMVDMATQLMQAGGMHSAAVNVPVT